MALAKAPAERVLLRQRSLPAGMDRLLQVAAGASTEALSEFSAQTGEREADILEAARFYAREILFYQGADAYRVLGVSHDADTDTIRTHHRLLQQWLHPDRHSSDWDAIFASRVNAAWSRLRNDERRRAYDQANPPQQRDEIPLSVGSPAWLNPQVDGGAVDSDRWRRRTPVLVLFAVCGVLAVLAIRDMQKEPVGIPGEGDPVATANANAKDLTENVVGQPGSPVMLRIPDAAAPPISTRTQKPRVEPKAAALAKAVPKSVDVAIAAKAIPKPIAVAVAAKPVPKPLAVVVAAKPVPKPIAVAVVAKPVPKPVAIAALAKPAPKSVAVASAAKPVPKPIAATVAVKPAPTPLAGGVAVMPVQKPLAMAVAAKPLPKTVAVSAAAKPAPKPVAATIAAKPVPKPLAVAVAAKPIPQKVAPTGAAKPVPKGAALAIAAKPLPKPIAPTAPAKPASTPIVATAAVAAQQGPPSKSATAEAPAGVSSATSASIAKDASAMSQQHMQQAQRVGGQLIAYMSKSSASIPPIWGSLATQRGAAQLREDLRVKGNVKVDAPNWRVGDNLAAMRANIRYGDGSVGRLSADLVWREQRWLISGLSVERDL